MADLEAQQHDSGHQQTDADYNEHTIAPTCDLVAPAGSAGDGVPSPLPYQVE
jgi:hypothetical protein